MQHIVLNARNNIDLVKNLIIQEVTQFNADKLVKPLNIYLFDYIKIYKVII